MFFQSLFPTFNAAEIAPAPAAPAPLPAAALGVPPPPPPVANAIVVNPNADDRNAVAGAAGDTAVEMESFAELRTSLNSIVDAMRDFLTNVRVPERPNDADVDENESSEDEPNDYLT